ncbi:MAG: NRDE family protein [Candidatus Acidiferrum sp.]
MCTLTLVPTKNGFLAGMNRDELRTRPAAIVPAIFDANGLSAIYPREISGGTWIAGNNSGNLLALLNCNSVNAVSVCKKLKSRGTVIPWLIGKTDFYSTDLRWAEFSLDGVLPFRLVGIFSKQQIVCEWQWDGARRDKLLLTWQQRHWFSSSLSDASAEKERGLICKAAASQVDAGGRDWLRRLHRSHIPAPGPFSICVHREDAATVSYVEVSCSGSSISMDYRDGNPCLKNNFDGQMELPILQTG